MKNFGKLTGLLSVLASALFLSGCEFDILNPAGYVAHNELILITTCVIVMACIVVPVMIAVVAFAIKYRATNTEAEYLPDWGHSNKVETLMWGIPIIAIIILASLTAYFTYKLEPSKPISAEVVGNEAPLQIDAVALDWKWLFIYPQYGVASINEIYAPANRQVFLQLTSENSVNAFWVPRLGTVLYAMPQMNAKLHLFANREGVFKGSSANYSGDGFSEMYFKWHSVAKPEFENWIAQARDSKVTLDRAGYRQLSLSPKMGDIPAKEKDRQIRYFSNVEKGLYYRIVNRCIDDGTTCNEDQMKLAAAKSLWGELCSVFDPGVVQKK